MTDPATPLSVKLMVNGFEAQIQTMVWQMRNTLEDLIAARFGPIMEDLDVEALIVSHIDVTIRKEIEMRARQLVSERIKEIHDTIETAVSMALAKKGIKGLIE